MMFAWEQRKALFSLALRVESCSPRILRYYAREGAERVINLYRVAGSCGHPTDEEFLNVPSEIITESMLSNQRYSQSMMLKAS